MAISLIEWKDSYSIGVPDVDHEHKEMIQIINELFTHIAGDDSHATTLYFLGEIYAKIASHFALEEKIMHEKKYDEFLDHKEDHDHLLDKILDIMDEYEQSENIDNEVFAEKLNNWFGEHFRTKDARLHKFLEH